MLSAAEIRMVQSDWESILPLGSTAATLFYDRLFELDPSLRPMFSPDMTEQKKKLIQVLGVVVDGLTDLPALVPVAQALGRRHSGYGVKSEHYDTVGAALLWTLKKALGDEFDRAHEAAWTQVYQLLAHTMQTAGTSEPPTRSRVMPAAQPSAQAGELPRVRRAVR